MKKIIKVVGAIIENNNNEILCALRSPIMSTPNMWEFPGGKVESNETLKEAIEKENLDSLKWAPADIPAVIQLISETEPTT